MEVAEGQEAPRMTMVSSSTHLHISSSSSSSSSSSTSDVDPPSSSSSSSSSSSWTDDQPEWPVEGHIPFGPALAPLPTHATLAPLAPAPRGDAAMADAAATAALAALASVPPNPIIAEMDALATVVETNIARKLGTPKPQTKSKPPLRQSARVRDQEAVVHTPEMNDDDAASATDDSRYDPDAMSEQDDVDGESD